MSPDNSLDLIVEMLAGIIDMRLGISSGGGRKIAQLCREMAIQAGLNEARQKAVYHAAMLHNLGLIGLSDEILKVPYNKLSEEKQRQFNSSPLKAEALLATIPELAEVAHCIRHLYEHYDGSGYPAGLSGDQIPIEGRIMVIAVDYHERQNGIYFSDCLSATAAFRKILAGRNTHYDPALVTLFESIEEPEKTDANENNELVLTSGQVIAGMILTRDLKLDGGMLLLAEGRALTEHVILGVMNLEKSVGQTFTFYVENTN
jgi:response regulator RpfG family c-di-GMP phosphodiesterase